MRKNWFILLLCAASMSAQDIYTPVLNQVERNSPSLQAFRQLAEAEQLAAKTGLAPHNPEVEVGYLWDKAGDDRKDVSVRQGFDFPSVYAHRAKLADINTAGAELRFRRERQQLLLAAKQTCVRLVYLNARLQLSEQRAERADQLAQAYARLLEKGACTQLEYNKAQINRTRALGDLQRTQIERQTCLADLARMAGEPVPFDHADYEPLLLPSDFDTWYAEAENAMPALLAQHNAAEAAARQVRLTRASAAPSFSVGYMGEFQSAQQLQGLTVGMALPLWSNAHRVRQAKAQALAATRTEEDTRLALRNRLQSLFAQAQALQQTLAGYDASLTDYNSAELLYHAFEGGELTLLQYLMESDYFFEAYDLRLQTLRDLHLVTAEMNAWQL